MLQSGCLHNPLLSSGHGRISSLACSQGGAALKPMSLQYHNLGCSDLYVSEVCLGTMTFGEQTPQDEAHKILSHARELGVNYFDTSELYPVAPKRDTQGQSSECLGNWLQAGGQKREEVVIASKVVGNTKDTKSKLPWVPANRTVPPGKEDMPRVDQGSIRSAVDGELRRLQTDYIDLFQIHWPDRYRPFFGNTRYYPEKEWSYVPFEEQAATMSSLIDEGKIRHWGLSNESTYGVTMMCCTADDMGVPRPISIQNSFSLIDRTFETSLAEACSPQNLDLPLLPWSAGGGGCLSGKYLDGKRPEGCRLSMFPERYFRFLTGRCEAAVRRYSEIAGEYGLTPMQLAYMFCKSRWFVGSTIIGATSIEQLDENTTGFALDLPPEALDAIDDVHLQYTNPQNLD